MNRKINFILSYFAALFIISCSESSTSETYLNVEPSTMNFTADGGSANFTITSNTSWTISMVNSNVQVSPTSGSGDQIVQVRVPESKDIQQKETKLMIKTNDGTVVRNLSVIQEGYLLTGGTLDVTNHSNMLVLNGTAKDVDSLIILSNAPWELRGPEWIEAYNGSRWVTLSPTRAMISGNAIAETSESRTTHILIRTASTNEDELDRNDFLILSQPYSGDLKVNINIMQLGKHRVSSNTYVPLATGIATDWKYGADVKTIYARLFNKELSNSELDYEISGDNKSKWEKCAPDNVTSWTSLEENSTYWLYTIGLDAGNNYYSIHGVQVFTVSSQNQAIASFKNVYFDGTKWHWEINMNEYCKGFFQWVLINPETFNYTDELLAWFFSYRLHDSELTKEHDLFTLFEYSEIEYNGHIQLITWGIGQDGVRMSGVISRYRSIDYYETRGLGHNEDAPRSMSVPKDILFSEKSFIKIK